MSTKTIKLFAEPKVNPARLNRAYFAYTYSDDASQFVRGEAVQLIYFKQGELFIDGLHIVQPQFGSRSLSWRQQTAAGFSCGHLTFDLNGVECQGTVALGQSATSHTLYNILATAVPPSTYNTQITRMRLPVGTDINSVPTDAWTEGLAFQLGYHDKPGQSFPSAYVTMDNQDISENIGLSVLNNDQLQLTLDLTGSGLCDFDSDLYVSGSIEFSTFGDTFTGQVGATCQDRTGQGAYLWRGTVTGQQPLAALDTASKLSAADLVSESTLSLAELMTLVPDEAMMKLANTMLTENMKWAMGQDAAEQDWLSTFFAEQPPVLSPEQQAIARLGADWYQQKFGVAYLTGAFDNWTGDGSPSIKLDDEQKGKLENYLQRGMAQDSSYNLQMSQLNSLAYLESRTRLQDYINDGGEKWAAALLAAITTPPQLTLLVNRLKASHDISAANNFSLLLLTLEPSGSYAKQYISTVILRVLFDASLQTKIIDKDQTMSWMPMALEAFVKLYGSPVGAGAPGASDSADERQQLANSVNNAAQEVGGFAALASQFTELLLTVKGNSFVEQSELARTAFVAQYPKLALAGNVLFCICLVGGLFSVLETFLNWKKESATQKANAITSCVSLIVGAIDKVIGWREVTVNLQTEGRIQDWAAENIYLLGDIAKNDMNADLTDPNWWEDNSQEIFEAFDGETKMIVTDGLACAKIFQTASKVIAVIGVAVSAAFTVLSGIDFAKAIKSGKPVSIKALDGIVTVGNGIATVCLVLNLFVSTVVFAIAAAVFAIIGLIASIILMFIPKPKAESPATKFMQQTGVPFVNGLPAPPQPAGAGAGVRLVYNSV